MLLALLVSVFAFAFWAVKFKAFNGLEHETVDLLGNFERLATVRAAIILIPPLVEALLTAHLIAIGALLRILNNHHADIAGEVAIERLLNGMIGIAVCFILRLGSRRPDLRQYLAQSLL